MIRELCEIGNPLLRERAKEIPVEDIRSERIQGVITDLVDTMHAAKGLGIAAPQIGELLRIFVVEVRDNPRYPYDFTFPLHIVVNPELSFLSAERFSNFEGCLSIPGLRGRVSRCSELKVDAYNGAGERVSYVVRGLVAGIFQHEYDHLEGILFPDRVDDLRTLCSLKEYEARYLEPLRGEIRELCQKYS